MTIKINDETEREKGKQKGGKKKKERKKERKKEKDYRQFLSKTDTKFIHALVHTIQTVVKEYTTNGSVNTLKMNKVLEND